MILVNPLIANFVHGRKAPSIRTAKMSSGYRGSSADARSTASSTSLGRGEKAGFGSRNSRGATSGTSSEYECMIHSVALENTEQVKQRIQALCDDGCSRLPTIHVREVVWQRKNTERGGLAVGPNTSTEIRVRTTHGDLVKNGTSTQICAAGQPKLLSRVDQEDRVEVLHYGHLQAAQLKALVSPVRSMLRIGVAGDVDQFLQCMLFNKSHEFCYTGERILTRENVEIDIFRRTSGFKNDTYIIPEGYSDVNSSPLIIIVRAIAGNDAEIERTAKKVRAIFNEIKIGSSMEEVKPDYSLTRRRDQIR